MVRLAAPSTFGRLHVLPLIPQLLVLHPKIKIDLNFSDSLQDLLADGTDLAIRISPVQHPDAVIKRVATTSLVCAGPLSYVNQYGIPNTPQDLANHNCLIYNKMTDWNFVGPNGKFSVAVSGNISSNTIEAILSAVRSGIGMFYWASLVGELNHLDIITVLDKFIQETRDVSLIWPRRKFIPVRVRAVTDFFAAKFA